MQPHTGGVKGFEYQRPLPTVPAEDQRRPGDRPGGYWIRLRRHKVTGTHPGGHGVAAAARRWCSGDGAWQQTQIPGGHALAMEAATPDGTVRIFETWEHIYTEGPGGVPELAGSRRIERSVWLNNIEITNPETAEWLYDLAVRPP